MDGHRDNRQQQQRFLRGLEEHLCTALTWLFLVGLFMLGRVLWILMLRGYLTGDAPVSDIPLALLQGFRVDAVVATYLLLPTIVVVFVGFPFAWSHRVAAVLRAVPVAFVCLTFPLLAVGSVRYFETFGDTFNIRVFDVLAGNVHHVFDIAVKQYQLATYLPLSLVVSGMLWSLYRRATRSRPALPGWVRARRWNRTAQIGLGTCLALLTAMSLRGSIGLRPLMHRDSCVTSQWVLNQGVLNPYFAIKCAWKQHRRAVRFEVGQDYLQRIDLPTASRLVSQYTATSQPDWSPGTDWSAGTAPETGGDSSQTFITAQAPIPQRPVPLVGPSAPLAGRDLDPINFRHPVVARQAAGPQNGPPSHVFILFIESYDAWPFLDKYRPLHLVEEGRRLARHGLHQARFLPGSDNSVDSFMVAVQGLHDTHKYKQQKLPTSFPTTFQRLGYRTRSINAFGIHADTGKQMIEQQGFEEAYFCHDIQPGGETNHNTVHDRTLYRFVESLAFDRPTLNVIYPQSYHAPFDLDLAAEGCILPPYPAELRSPNNHDERQRRLAYGHLKYSDRCMGEFVAKMIRRFPRALFVITGDHFCRNPISKDMGIYEQYAVPLILYGPQILQGHRFPEHAAGSHLDLVATVTELTAPAGFRYHALGHNLLKPRQHSVAVGTDHIILGRSIFCLKGSGRREDLPWNASPPGSSPSSVTTLGQARRVHDAFHGLSYALAKDALTNGVPATAEAPTTDAMPSPSEGGTWSMDRFATETGSPATTRR